MKRLLPHFLTCTIAAMMLSTAFVLHADNAEFIYLMGKDGYYFPPSPNNADKYEDAKLYETAPGSGIYEGVFTMPSSDWYVRFYTELSESVEEEWDCSRNHLIIPASGDGNLVQELGRSHVSKESLVYKVYSYYTPTFRISQDSGSLVKLRVDMNEGAMYAVSENAVVAVVNSDAEPTFESAVDFTSIDRTINQYVPAGDLKFRFYDFFSDKWLGNAGEIAIDSEYVRLPVEESENFFVVDDWKGGVVTFWKSSGNYYNVSLDTSRDPYLAESVYAIGDFCVWDFSGSAVGTKISDYVFSVTIPAGAGSFKITDGMSWDVNFGMGDIKEVLPDGSVVVSLVPEGGNFTFSEATTSDITCTIDFENYTITFPGGTDFAVVNSMIVSTASDFLELSSANGSYLAQYNKNLPETAPGIYYGTISVPAGEFKIRFVKQLGADASQTVMYSPGEDNREIVKADGVAYSSVKEAALPNAGYWTCSDWNGGAVTITVDTNNHTVKFEFASEVQTQSLYLIGMPSGWMEPSTGNAELLSQWELGKVSQGLFYGSFDIAAGAAMFRFYSALTGWDYNSIGCSLDDMPSEFVFIDGEFSGGLCEGGKGSWSFSDWQGGTMYMLVDTENDNVKFSTSPIDYTDLIRPEKNVIYSYFDGKYTAIEETTAGSGIYIIDNISDGELRLFTKQLPISPDEAEWAGSYSISAPSDGYRFEFDEFGIAKTYVSITNEVTTIAANSFDIKVPMGAYSVCLVVDLNEEIVYADAKTTYFLVGELNGNEVPTYSDYRNFNAYALSILSGFKMMNIPEGKFDFQFYKLSEGEFIQAEADNVTFVDGVATPDDFFVPFKRCKIDDWAGGTVVIAPSILYNYTNTGTLYVLTDGEELSSLNEISSGAGVYTGKVTLESLPDSEMKHTAYILFDPDVMNFYLGSLYGSSSGMNFYSMPADERLITIKDGHAVKTLGFNSIGFTYSNIFEGEVEVTVDLYAQTITVNTSNNTVPTYQIMAPGNESNVDEVAMYPSSSDDNGASVNISNVPAGDIDFNIVCDDNYVIVPADGTTVVTPDEFGTWSGKFARVATQRTVQRSVATMADKWVINNPDEGSISFAIDEGTQTISISIASANKTFYVSYQDYETGEWGVKPTIENVEQLKQSVLRETVAGSGIYEGICSFPANDYICVYIYNEFSDEGMLRTVSPRYYSMQIFEDLTESVTLPTTDHFDYMPWFVVGFEGGDVYVTYNANDFTLTMKKNVSGVENVSVEGASMNIIPGYGQITVVCNAEAMVSVYSMQGLLVRNLRVQPGSTTIELPAGLYIVNRTKVLVK